MAIALEKQYIDMLIRINPSHTGESYYPVEAWVEDTGAIRQHFDGGHFYFPPDEEQQIDPQAYGLALYYALFSGSIMQAYDYAQTLSIIQSDGRIRVRLWVHSAAADLHKIMWERMHYPHQQGTAPFAARAKVPFSRYIDLTQSYHEPSTDRVIRMLFAMASPADVDRYGLSTLMIDDELAVLRESLKDLIDAGRLRLTVMPGYKGLSDTFQNTLQKEGWDIFHGPTTQENILHLLGKEAGYHVFHFLGHGRFSRTDSATMLYLEGRSGNAHIVRDQDFAVRIASVPHTPELVFMAACETTRRDSQSGNPYVGFAPTLIKSGVPAVIVMQDRFPVDTSQQLTQLFYRYLLDDGIVDQAMSQARLLLHTRRQDAWDIPVLFTRLENGRLFRRDPILSVLNRMWDADEFNPLSSDNEYIPLEVVHIAGGPRVSVLSFHKRDRKPSRDSLTALTDLLYPASPADPDDTSELPGVVILSGDAGMGKTVLIRRLGKIAVQDSLESDISTTTIPLYVNLQSLAQTINNIVAIEKVLWQSLLKYWTELSFEKFVNLLSDKNGPVFWLLLDSAEVLTQYDRHRFWITLSQFINKYPRHNYVMTYNTNLDELPLKVDMQTALRAEFSWGSKLELLVIQPISQRTTEWFLYGQGEAGIALYKALERGQLYNITESPWVLNLLLQKARRGEFPQSLTQVVRDLFEDAISVIASSQGKRARAAETLYAIACEMHLGMRRTLTIDKAFEIMASIRASRRYNLETLFDEYIKNEQLSTVGDDYIRFSRSVMQSYCCAQALLRHSEREKYLDDITATLGRRRRFYWWSEPLILLAGLGYDPSVLIRHVLYGMESGAGEQVLLAALIVQECKWVNINAQVITHLVQSLIYYLNSRREPRIWRRIQLAEALGKMRHPDAIPHLVGVANQRVRLTSLGRERAFEHSTVRLAAVFALRQIATTPYADVQHIDHELAKILTWWDDGDIMALGQYLVDADMLPDELKGSQAIAAFALGDLQTFASVDILINLFLYPNSSDETYRHLTTALTLIDPGIVEKNVILPFIERESPNRLDDRVWEKRDQYLSHIIYLAGRIYSTDPRILASLRSCLLTDSVINHRVLAMQSLGWLHAEQTKSLIEKISLGHMSDLKLSPSVTFAEKRVLQKQALEALFYLGDTETLKLYQKRPANWTPEFERSLYWTSEEILWRQEMGHISV